MTTWKHTLDEERRLRQEASRQFAVACEQRDDATRAAKLYLALVCLLSMTVIVLCVWRWS